MNDFPVWRQEILAAKTIPELEKVGRDIKQFQSQADMFDKKKMAEGQVEQLRKMYSDKLAKLKAEQLFPPQKP